jgi:copper chaperone CopZ
VALLHLLLHLLLLSSASCHVIDSPEHAIPLRTHSVTTLDFASLSMPTPNPASSRLLHALVTTGAVAVTGIPGYRAARRRALGSLPGCFARTGAEAAVELGGGTLRQTVAARGGEPIRCGPAVARLRSLVDATAWAAFEALDAAAALGPARHALKRGADGKDETHRGLLMRPDYDTLSELLADAHDSLEHFHLYTPTTATATPTAPGRGVALATHVDDGLMIAMTPGMLLSGGISGGGGGGNDGAAAGLVLRLPHGEDVMAGGFDPDDAVLLLVGEGGAKWLGAAALGSAAPLRAAPHALLAPASPRAWYGRMFLPPGRALMPDGLTTFADYREQKAAKAAKAATALAAAAKAEEQQERQERQERQLLGDEAAPRRGLSSTSVASSADSSAESSADSSRLARRQVLLHGKNRPFAATASAATASAVKAMAYMCTTPKGTKGALCWMSCMEAPSGCGLSSAVCMDTKTDMVNSGNITCPSGMGACKLQCPSSLAPSPSPSPKPVIPAGAPAAKYCMGMGMDMNMMGFHWILAADDANPCINLFFEGWTLNSAGKAWGGLVGLFLVAFLKEALTAARRVYFNKSLAAERTSGKRASVAGSAAVVLLYVLQLAVGNFIMLAVMTFSMDIFLTLMIGMGAGYAVFNLRSPPPEDTNTCCSGAGLDGDGELRPASTCRVSMAEGDGLRSSLLSAASVSAYTKDGGRDQMVILGIEGMMCMANCGKVVEAALLQTEGVRSARVIFSEHKAIVEGVFSPKDLVDAVEAVGFDAGVREVIPSF